MDEQQTTDVVEQADANTPDQGTGDQVNWEERYANLQPEYTKATQRIAEIEADPEAYLRSKGFVIVDDDEPADTVDVDSADDEVAALRQKLERLESSFAQTEQEARQAQQIKAFEDYSTNTFAKLEKAGAQLDDDDKTWIVAKALTMPAGPDGMPPIEDAHKAFEARWEARQQKWASTKRTTHRVSPNGAPGTQQPDLSTTEGKIAYAQQLLADRE